MVDVAVEHATDVVCLPDPLVLMGQQVNGFLVDEFLFYKHQIPSVFTEVDAHELCRCKVILYKIHNIFFL